MRSRVCPPLGRLAFRTKRELVSALLPSLPGLLGGRTRIAHSASKPLRMVRSESLLPPLRSCFTLLLLFSFWGLRLVPVGSSILLIVFELLLIGLPVFLT